MKTKVLACATLVMALALSGCEAGKQGLRSAFGINTSPPELSHMPSRFDNGSAEHEWAQVLAAAGDGFSRYRGEPFTAEEHAERLAILEHNREAMIEAIMAQSQVGRNEALTMYRRYLTAEREREYWHSTIAPEGGRAFIFTGLEYLSDRPTRNSTLIVEFPVADADEAGDRLREFQRRFHRLIAPERGWTFNSAENHLTYLYQWAPPDDYWDHAGIFVTESRSASEPDLRTLYMREGVVQVAVGFAEHVREGDTS